MPTNRIEQDRSPLSERDEEALAALAGLTHWRASTARAKPGSRSSEGERPSPFAWILLAL